MEPYTRHERPKNEDNPHCSQASEPYYAKAFEAVLLHGHGQRLKYIARDKKERFLSVLHRGQRKLLMSEIEALVRLDPQEKYTVAYAGAAPGIHIPMLIEMFPNVAFHLYDPRALAESDKIKLFNVYFTDEIAQSYADSDSDAKLVFISDIRGTIDEWNVWEDILSQKRWHEIMMPHLMSLKFRLPWPQAGSVVEDKSNDIEYLDGEINLPVWGPCNTTESRLMIEKGVHSGVWAYDCLAYEEEMCFFNRVTLPSVRLRVGGLDGCYDCTAEVRLLDLYNKKWDASRFHLRFSAIDWGVI